MKQFLVICSILLFSIKSKAQLYLDLKESQLIGNLIDEKAKDIYRGENSQGIFVSWRDTIVEWDATAFFKNGVVSRTIFNPFSSLACDRFNNYLNETSAVRITNEDWKLYDENKIIIIERRKFSDNQSCTFTIWRLK